MAWLTISGSQAPLRCWFERPQQPRSLVLVLPEVFGINSWLRDVASQLVAAGHGVLVMPLFARTAPSWMWVTTQPAWLKDVSTVMRLPQLASTAMWMR